MHGATWTRATKHLITKINFMKVQNCLAHHVVLPSLNAFSRPALL